MFSIDKQQSHIIKKKLVWVLTSNTMHIQVGLTSPMIKLTKLYLKFQYLFLYAAVCIYKDIRSECKMIKNTNIKLCFMKLKIYTIYMKFESFWVAFFSCKVSKGAKIRNRYN